MWWLFVAALLQLTHEEPQAVPSCNIRIDRCTYKLVIDEIQGDGCHQQNSISYSDTTSRHKRTATMGTPDIGLQLHKIRRRLIRVQNKLVRSMSDLSKRVLRGVRTLEDKLEQLEGEGQMKREVDNTSHDVGCPHGFEYVKSWDSCFILSNFNATWYEARDYCAAIDSELVGLKHEKEHNLLAFIIKNSPVYSQVDGWWLSLTFHDNTRQWMWKSETLMRPFTFIKWAPEEPNEESLQCAYMARDANHMWRDAVCTQSMNFICEVPRK